jgi:hypothetical protein
MHQNMFSTIPEVKKQYFKDFYSGGLEMDQNTVLTIPDVKKYLYLRT